MNNQTQQRILNIAHTALRNYFAGKMEVNDIEDDPELHRKSGVFVSIYVDGTLRGCIGHIEDDKPLSEIIAQMAVAAATKDPRFLPLTEDEFDHLTFEISVLSPFEAVKDPEEIIIGEHGLFIEAENARGLLLPQVAERYQWTPDEFLRETCKKAGLPEDAYTREEVKISKFSAFVITETE